MISNPCLIVLDEATVEELEAVQEAVRENANGWWHHFTNVWIAGGRTPKYWQDLIKPLIPKGPSSLLVLALPPNQRDRKTGAYMPQLNARMEWIRKTYQGRNPDGSG